MGWVIQNKRQCFCPDLPDLPEGSEYDYMCGSVYACDTCGIEWIVRAKQSGYDVRDNTTFYSMNEREWKQR